MRLREILFLWTLAKKRFTLRLLSVDADANSNLNEVLGVEAGITLGELREEIERAGSDSRYKIPVGVTKKDYLETRLADALQRRMTLI